MVGIVDDISEVKNILNNYTTKESSIVYPLYMELEPLMSLRLRGAEAVCFILHFDLVEDKGPRIIMNEKGEQKYISNHISYWLSDERDKLVLDPDDVHCLIICPGNIVETIDASTLFSYRHRGKLGTYLRENHIRLKTDRDNLIALINSFNDHSISLGSIITLPVRLNASEFISCNTHAYIGKDNKDPVRGLEGLELLERELKLFEIPPEEGYEHIYFSKRHVMVG